MEFISKQGVLNIPRWQKKNSSVQFIQKLVDNKSNNNKWLYFKI